MSGSNKNGSDRRALPELAHRTAQHDPSGGALRR